MQKAKESAKQARAARHPKPADRFREVFPNSDEEFKIPDLPVVNSNDSHALYTPEEIAELLQDDENEYRDVFDDPHALLSKEMDNESFWNFCELDDDDYFD